MTFGILSLGPEKFIREFSVFLIFLTVILNLFVSKKEYKPKIFIVYLTLFLCITLNFLLTGPGIGDLTALMDKRGIGTWICFGLIFISYNDKRYEFFKKFIIISVLVISALALFNLVDFGSGAYRGQALSKYRVYAVNMMWITPYIFLITKNNPKLIFFRFYALFIGVFLALIIQTRSFLLIYTLVIAFDFFYTKKKTYYTVGILIAAVLFVFILISTPSLSSSLDLLMQRGTNDTRSGQLDVFISQLNFFEVIVGKGYYASYFFNGRYYPFLDNQWLLLIWWAGFIPAMAYFYLTAVIPIKLFFKKNQDYETKVEALILIIWCLACGGLAIYTIMMIDYFFFIICIIQSRLLYKFSKT
ncbi:hypothetical protein [Algibacter sp. R77976]|uniref:hypothetical protein n=1 Tax=Algibacter sp. R77976 TaxID=3093873 RepID=UPI0037C525CC